MKNIGEHSQNIFDFELTIDKDLKSQDDHWNITNPTVLGNDRILKLTAADFGGRLDESKISIDDTEYHTDPNNKIKVVEDRRGQKWALLNLEKLLKKVEDKYGKVIEAFGYFNKKKGPDFEIDETFSKISELGEAPHWKKLVPTSGLFSYYSDNTDGFFPKIPFKDRNIRHILGNLRDGKNVEIYRDEIEEKISSLSELFYTSFFFGKVKKSQLFIIDNYRDDDGKGLFEDDKEIMRQAGKETGFYKGFPIIDPNLQALPDPADDNRFKISLIDPTKPVRFTQKNIDAFRSFATGSFYSAELVDVFTKTKTITNKNGKAVQVYANRSPEECWGYQPGDIIRKADGKHYYMRQVIP
ncbi:MAG: hypothetical protein MRERC_1c028 [Mycoplasmataceae bacterium RC_NB112A]|nr:MAG: hypothetical protein MRERC_10c012 [Mycoplasmataceae bacterium RC_NB112A]KLL02447.1 MAG: hypothetical protein MRERC_1c028 [Mycoplasmataceae bacterium RC_NB112A]